MSSEEISVLLNYNGYEFSALVLGQPNESRRPNTVGDLALFFGSTRALDHLRILPRAPHQR